MKFIIAGLVIILLLLQLRLWKGDGGVMEVIALHKKVKEQEVQVGVLEERNHQLEAEVQDLKNRLDAIEERARADLGMVRKGETFYQDAS